MNDKEIIEVIDSYINREYRDFSQYYDSVAWFTFNFQQIDDFEKESVFNFFLAEIIENNYNKWKFCLDVIVEGNFKKLACNLEEIFRNYSKSKDEYWNKQMINAMLDLKYGDAMEIYLDYISQISNVFGNDCTEIFDVSTKICTFNFSIGSELLVDFLVKYSVDFLKKNAGYFFFIKYLINEPNFLIVEIIKRTAKKNLNVGINLKNEIHNFLNSTMVNEIKTKLLNENIIRIKELNL